MSGAKSLKKGEILFREGDSSDCMFVIKTGKIAITKAKGSSEILLAELGPGDMLGEMAFFDNKPRSAGAKASADTVVIELPFKSLNAQFKTFPEWLKAVVRTVNNHLRNANQRIKNLEKSQEEETSAFPPLTITKLTAILSLVTARYGESTPEGLVVPFNRLRNYTIQVFQQPTNKMDKLMEILQQLGHMKVEDLGEGKVKITVFHLDFLVTFTEFYNEYLFKDESKRVTVDERELVPLKALIHYGKGIQPDGKGMVKVNLTQVQATAPKELGVPCAVDDFAGLASKKLTSQPMAGEGAVFLTYEYKVAEILYPVWELIYTLKKIVKS